MSRRSFGLAAELARLPDALLARRAADVEWERNFVRRERWRRAAAGLPALTKAQRGCLREIAARIEAEPAPPTIAELGRALAQGGGELAALARKGYLRLPTRRRGMSRGVAVLALPGDLGAEVIARAEELRRGAEQPGT